MAVVTTPTGFRAHASHGTTSASAQLGVIGIMETGSSRKKMECAQDLPGHLKVGGYYEPKPLTEFSTGLSERGTWGTYLAIDQRSGPQAIRPARGVSPCSRRFITRPPTSMRRRNSFDCGAVYVGLIPDRTRISRV